MHLALDVMVIIVVITALLGAHDGVGDGEDGDAHDGGELVCTCVSRFLSSGC